MSEQEHFGTVIIGSGFGGSVMAHELAKDGKGSVCLLERGKAYPPGSFPRSPRAVGQNFWEPDRGFYGLFNAWTFRSLEAVVSSGLGGGSLIYANVLIRKEEKWFRPDEPGNNRRPWPIRRADLEPHYDAAEAMLRPQRFPMDEPAYQVTLKTKAFRDAVSRVEGDLKVPLHWTLPNLAITFANDGRPAALGEPIAEDGPNLHGLPRYTCRLTGECDVGCNFGSKNSLDYNYLTHAKRHGAEIQTLAEVKTIRPRSSGRGFEIEYDDHSSGEPAAVRSQGPVKITADRLVLSAGTLNSTYLLLRNRQNFPAISAQLGTRFCGNGDLLTFALKCLDKEGKNPRARQIDPSRGPVITSTIRVDDESGTGGFYIQDAGYPEFVNWAVESMNAPGLIGRAFHFLVRRAMALLTGDPRSDLGGQLMVLMGKSEVSCCSMPLLGMGTDRPDGVMSLRGRRGQYLDIKWNKADSESYYRRVEDVSRRIAVAMGADFQENPFTRYLNRLITVHPLGGCPMGMTEAEGVVGTDGQVFGYPGLYVADGSVMPGPVGANPSLTIAAISHKFARGIINGTP